jgi:hypothetical protein
MTGWYVTIGRITYGYTDRLKGRHKATWSGFTRHLVDAGYHPPEADHGPGAVVGFDEHGRGEVLTTKASSPVEFVAAIRKVSKKT